MLSDCPKCFSKEKLFCLLQFTFAFFWCSSYMYTLVVILCFALLSIWNWNLNNGFVICRLPVLAGAAGAMGASYCNPYLSVDSAYHTRPSGQTLPIAAGLRSVLWSTQNGFLNNLPIRYLLWMNSLTKLETKAAFTWMEWTEKL